MLKYLLIIKVLTFIKVHRFFTNFEIFEILRCKFVSRKTLGLAITWAFKIIWKFHLELIDHDQLITVYFRLDSSGVHIVSISNQAPTNFRVRSPMSTTTYRYFTKLPNWPQITLIRNKRKVCKTAPPHAHTRATPRIGLSKAAGHTQMPALYWPKSINTILVYPECCKTWIYRKMTSYMCKEQIASTKTSARRESARVRAQRRATRTSLRYPSR